MSKQILEVGDIISYLDENGQYVFVDLIVKDCLEYNIYEVLDLVSHEGVYKIMWAPSESVEVI
jgi:hypothetical protein